MRFILVDKQARTFQTQRYCYRRAIDRWINIGAPGPLDQLVRTYVRHVGQESYYELF